MPAVAESNISVSEDTTDPNANAVLLGQNGEAYLVGPAGATGKVFTNNAQAVINNGNWTVTVELRKGAEGEDLWNALTTQMLSIAMQHALRHALLLHWME